MRTIDWIAAFSCVLGSTPAIAGSISLFTTPLQESCNLSILPPSDTGTFYVVAVDATEPILCGPGFTGAAFRISGLPAGWTAVVTASPVACVGTGDVLGTGGNIVFCGAQQGAAILLYTIVVTPPAPGASATLHVEAQIPPPFGLNCPVRTGPGDCPADFDVACVDGGTLYINSPGDCTVTVSPGSWAGVKSLYR